MVTTIALALILGWQAEQGVGSGNMERAERLARDGRTREALEQFERIVSRHPDDVEARIWVARLLGRQGRPDLAEQEFRRVLIRAPHHVDALVGLADALCSLGLYGMASEPLDEAERLAPQSAEVLASRARALRLAGRWADAEAYYARARALSPGDRDIEQRLQETQRVNRNRIEGSFQHESVAGEGPGGHIGDLAIDVRGTDRIRVNARVQAQKRFARQEARAGGGVEWRPLPNLTLRGSALLSPGAELIARTDTIAEIEHARGRAELGAGVRGVTFATARVWIVAPTVTLWLNDRAAVTARYYWSATSFSHRPVVTNHSGLARLRYNLRPRVSLDIGYSRGYESIDTLSSDRLDSFRADTVSGGVVGHLSGLQSIATGVDYQRSSGGRTMVRVTAAVIQRF
jgi:YaiO family outer membrane protein